MWKKCEFVIFLLITETVLIFGVTENRVEVTRLLNRMLKNYDKRLRPFYNKSPARIGINMHVTTISTISELDMEFTVDIFFRQSWHDDRLSFNLSSNIKKLVVGREILERIWVPDTYFVNEKSASFHDATTRNTFVRIHSTGEIETR